MKCDCMNVKDPTTKPDRCEYVFYYQCGQEGAYGRGVIPHSCDIKKIRDHIKTPKKQSELKGHISEERIKSGRELQKKTLKEIKKERKKPRCEATSIEARDIIDGKRYSWKKLLGPKTREIPKPSRNEWMQTWKQDLS